MSAIISFLGGSVFRMVWGEISSYITRWQDHKHEIELQNLQAKLESERHERDMARLKLQAELGVKEIQVQSDAILSKVEADAWLQAVKDVGQKTGILFLDIWNGSVRPLLATLAIGVVVFEIIKNGGTLSDWDRELVSAILGIYVADRTLAKRGK